MVGTAVGIIAILLVFRLLVVVQSQYAALNNKMRIENEVSQLAFFVHHYLGMAVNLTTGPFDINGDTFSTPFGRIVREYNMGAWMPSAGDGAVDVIAYFLRDTMSSREVADPKIPITDRFAATGIFFQRPTTDRYGVLYLTTMARGEGGDLVARRSDYFFEGLVDFRVRNVITTVFNNDLGLGANFIPPAGYQLMVSSVTIDVTQRHYQPSVQPDAMRWCPPASMINVDCQQGNFAYRDITKTFVVKIKNNVIGYSTTQRVEAPGPPSLGVARYVPRWLRPYENVYFLRPSYPKEALTR